MQHKSLNSIQQIKMDNPALGSSSEDRTESVGKIMNEVNIMKEQVNHPSH